MITKGPIPYSQSLTYAEQKEMIHELGKGDYECPSILDILISTGMHARKTGEIPHVPRPVFPKPLTWSYSACKERSSASRLAALFPLSYLPALSPVCLQSNVSAWGHLELDMTFTPHQKNPHACVGMAAVRKFPKESSSKSNNTRWMTNTVGLVALAAVATALAAQSWYT